MKKTILIVDDNSANLYLLKSLLESSGFDVLEAVNGRDALDMALVHPPPDLILSDILMPVMDGYALCRECKSDERLKYIPFVFYTATFTDAKDEEFALSLGADRFLIKPQEPEILLKVLDEILAAEYSAQRPHPRPLGEEMEFFRRHDEALFRKLEKKMSDLERANRQLAALEEQYRLSFENASDVIITLDAEYTITGVSPSIERMLGYKPQELMGRHYTDLKTIVTPESIKKIFADVNLIRNGDIIAASVYEYVARDGAVKIVEVSSSPVIRDGRFAGLIAIARDITERRQMDRERQENFDRLRKSLEATVRAMAVTVETRDPYTAGHQRRVAGLACAIAEEMRLPTEQVDGLRMAAVIHDIGKISIPAEILSMPRKLTATEFSLIKTHSEAGYDILKDIDFPWPIARIIREHHERIDGSGYPNGLTGENVLPESRVLAVADVVEAMASHRPYRPGLGLGPAMDEITKNKGILYDPEAVDACIRLFREKGYRLE
ncbi:MAG: PAS domain S-box protein [Deltaproteobacteria bacterium]|nr:PAS domain S-box protein [Deltaproteobacteria bacterium]